MWPHEWITQQLFRKAINSVQFSSDWRFSPMGFICNRFNYCRLAQMFSVAPLSSSVQKKLQITKESFQQMPLTTELFKDALFPPKNYKWKRGKHNVTHTIYCFPGKKQSHRVVLKMCACAIQSTLYPLYCVNYSSVTPLSLWRTPWEKHTSQGTR